jgi:hypothetical protein
MSQEHRDLKRTAGDLRLIGGVFVLIGIAPFVLGSRTPLSWTGQVLAIVNTAILIGPGVWYIIAASLMKRLHPSAARISMLIAFVQIAIVTLCLLAAFLGNREAAQFAVSACAVVFQIPAMIVLLFTLRHASRIVQRMSAVGHAFEPIAVQPLEPPPIDNLREK